MKLFLALLLISPLVIAKAPRFDNTRLFLKIKKSANIPQIEGMKKVKHLFGENYLVETDDALALEKKLKSINGVVRVEKNYYAEKKALPEVSLLSNKDLDEPEFFDAFNDPKADKVWSFRDADKNGVSVNKSYLAPLNITKTEIIVAVVDTGVDYNHEDLKDVMWINKLEIPGNGIDDDNNGYVDDVHGINLLDKNDDGVASGNPMASHAHGTHVSGTIGATQNNGIGIAGIASTVKIMAIRAVPDASDETDADVVESFLYAANHGAKLINCSFGKSHNEGGLIVNETIDYIGKDFGVLVFAAAGNDYGRNIDKDLQYPASFPTDYLLVVASTAKSGGLSWFSNIGLKNVDLAAPGSDIYSTVPGNSYAGMSGTSMATPTTVGVAAEVLSHFPEMGPLDLKKTLMDSVTPVEKFKKKMVTGGRVDLLNALTHALNN